MEEFETIYKNGSRIYRKEGVNYPSVTSILSVKSPFKGKPGAAAGVGTLVHADLAKLYKPIDDPWVQIWGIPFEEVTRRRRSCLRMWRDVMGQFDIRDVEFAVFNNEPGNEYAGRIDFGGIDSEGVPFIGDWKTGLKYNTYVPQASAYCHAMCIERAYLVYLDTHLERNPEQKIKMEILDKVDLDAGYEEFLDCYRIFKEAQSI